MSRILANAYVDPDGPDWRVTVFGGAYPDDERPMLDERKASDRRVYAITAKSDSIAAQEGIRRFVEELGG